MLMTKERPPAIRTLRGWAISVLLEAGAIRECEEHGWMHDRADPHARERALVIARQDPLPGVSPEETIAELRDVLDRTETAMTQEHAFKAAELSLRAQALAMVVAK